MKKKVLTTEAVKREIEKPGPPVELKPISTSDVRGGKVEFSDREFVERYAQSGDWKTLREIIEAKQKTRTEGWRLLPGGIRIPADLVLFRCTRCRVSLWLDETADGQACPNCNAMAYSDGGHLRHATKAESKEWFEHEEAGVAKWKADAPKRKAQLAAFNERLRQDMKGE